jgi:hypothetical protein
MKERRRRPSQFKRNAKYAFGLIGIAAVLSAGIALSTQGLETMLKRASLAFKAMDNPAKLNTEEKEELKKMIKNKGGMSKDQFDKLSAEEKAKAKQQYGNLSEEEKQRVRQMMGK